MESESMEFFSIHCAKYFTCFILLYEISIIFFFYIEENTDTNREANQLAQGHKY